MKAVFAALAALSCIHVTHGSQSSNDPVEINWVNIGAVVGNTNITYFDDPVGREIDTTVVVTKLCRTYTTGTWVPGKLVGTNCYVSKTVLSTSTQISNLHKWSTIPSAGYHFLQKEELYLSKLLLVANTEVVIMHSFVEHRYLKIILVMLFLGLTVCMNMSATFLTVSFT